MLSYNSKRVVHKGWHLETTIRPDGEFEDHLFVIELEEEAEPWLPPEGQKCCFELVNNPSDRIPISTVWEADYAGAGNVSPSSCVNSMLNPAFFKVTLAKPKDNFRALQPLFPKGLSAYKQDDVKLEQGNAIWACLRFRHSETTTHAELAALSRLLRDNGTDSITSSQKAAFKYLATFEEPEYVNLFEKYPRMAAVLNDSSDAPLCLRERFASFNRHQKEAFARGLSKIPAGVFMLPGGPGSGKTHWALSVVGAIQWASKAKVLVLMDINRPLDDIYIKYKSMCREVFGSGIMKKAIRVKAFGSELRTSSQVGSVRNAQRAAKKETAEEGNPLVDFSGRFLSQYRNPAARRLDVNGLDTQVLSLDNAAWHNYETHLDKYKTLTEGMLSWDGDVMENRGLKSQIFHLYQDVLTDADFVATTPCVASGAFHKMYKPDLVILDEAAHTRELTTLIPIANFSHCVYLLIGDFRQTLPFVRNAEENVFAPQLLVSTMERASREGQISHELLVNHRSFAGLERLASRLIYNNKMISGIEPAKRFSTSVHFVQEYLSRLWREQDVDIPRMIFHLLPIRRGRSSRINIVRDLETERQRRRPYGRMIENEVNHSWWNPLHRAWVMQRALELVLSPQFRNATVPHKPGTILILSPYKEAVKRYKANIEAWDAFLGPDVEFARRVEARTWDVSQGHEADIVAIDYVRGRSTKFMDGMHRFNVSLTRARQGEFHVMQLEMVQHKRFAKDTKYLCQLHQACLDGSEGHVASVNTAALEMLLESKG
jgi:hypothetical protein